MQPKDIKVEYPDGKIMLMRGVEESTPTVYVNNAAFGLTQWDINVELSEVQGIIDEDDIPVAMIKRRVRLVMTVPYAKVFAETLLKHLDKYYAIGKSIEKLAADSSKSEEEPKITIK